MQNKLPPAFKKQWIKALKSGDYPKGQDELVNLDDETNKPIGYCCLGVAGAICGLTVKDMKDNAYLDNDLLKNIRDKKRKVKLDAYKSIPEVIRGNMDSEIASTLSSLNDKSKDFAPVIEWIQENL